MDGNSLIRHRGRQHAEISLPTRMLNAALVGDWKEADEILENDPKLIRAPITPSLETALHIAALVAKPKHEYFVEKLLEKIPGNDIESIRNTVKSTALHFAAISGNVKIAKLMVNENTQLPMISNEKEASPLLLAAMSGNGEMVDYLLPLSGFKSWDDVKKSELLITCIKAGLYGAAEKVIECKQAIALAKDANGETPLDVLARNPSAFSCTSQPGWWTRKIYALTAKKFVKEEINDVFRLLDQILQQVPQADIENQTICKDIGYPLFAAAKLGNYEFVVELLRQRPEFLYILDHHGCSLFHIAIEHRQEPIFSLIYEIGKLKDFVATYTSEEEHNTMLHLAADLAAESQPKNLPGAALQMHQELLWYKAVEKVVPPTYRNMKNKLEKTPHELFLEKHENMMKEGEKWMKKTAQSCMVVATLIATVVFAAAFAIPGGYDNGGGKSSGGGGKAGEPILLDEWLFTLFTIADAIAMLSSTTSIIMFLCISTSRFAEEDFLGLLPNSLLIGILSLFISLAGMVLAFCASVGLYRHQHGSAVFFILLGVVACVLMTFAKIMYGLTKDVIRTTCGSKGMFRSRSRLISK